MNYLQEDRQSGHYRIKQNNLTISLSKLSEKNNIAVNFPKLQNDRSYRVVPHDGSDMVHSGSFLILLAGEASWEELYAFPFFFYSFYIVGFLIECQKLLHIHQFIR